jgi:hypothetical protein
MRLYCSECGLRLNTARKAMRAYGTIIDVVEPHVCSEIPSEIDLGPISTLKQPTIGGKFADKLDSIQPPTQSPLVDQRPAPSLRNELGTSAPIGILEGIRSQISKGVSSAPTESLPEGGFNDEV